MTINMNLRQRGCVGDMDSQLFDRRRGGPSFERSVRLSSRLSRPRVDPGLDTLVTQLKYVVCIWERFHTFKGEVTAVNSRGSWQGRRFTGPLAAAAGLALVMSGMAGTAASADGSEQITNGAFSDGLTGWNNYPNPTVDAGQGCIAVPAGSGAYSAAISQKPLPMVKDETYVLKFTASATPGPSGTVRAVIQSGAEQNYAQALPEKVLDLTPTLQPYTYTFTSAVDIPAAELAFQQVAVNTAAYKLCVDDVSLTGGAAPVVYTPNTGPRVRVNQVGYLPKGPKGATLVTCLLYTSDAADE